MRSLLLCLILYPETFRKAFRPVDERIYFAGEHADVDNTSTMEEAAESGFMVVKMMEK